MLCCSSLGKVGVEWHPVRGSPAQHLWLVGWALKSDLLKDPPEGLNSLGQAFEGHFLGVLSAWSTQALTKSASFTCHPARV